MQIPMQIISHRSRGRGAQTNTPPYIHTYIHIFTHAHITCARDTRTGRRTGNTRIRRTVGCTRPTRWGGRRSTIKALCTVNECEEEREQVGFPSHRRWPRRASHVGADVSSAIEESRRREVTRTGGLEGRSRRSFDSAQGHRRARLIAPKASPPPSSPPAHSSYGRTVGRPVGLEACRCADALCLHAGMYVLVCMCVWTCGRGVTRPVTDVCPQAGMYK